MAVRPLAGSFGVDPVVEGVIGAYYNDPDNFVYNRVFQPVENGGALRGVVNLVSLDSFFGDPDNTLLRAPNDEARTLLGPGISNVTYNMREWAAKSGPDDREITNAEQRGLPVPLQQLHAKMAAEAVRIKIEQNCAAFFLNATNFAQTSTPGTKWDNASATPFANTTGNIELAYAAVEANGRSPNTIIMSRDVARYLMTNTGTSALLRNLSDNVDQLRISRAVLAAIFMDNFGMELFVADAVYNSASLGQTASIGSIWGDGVWIGFIDRGGAADSVVSDGGTISLRATAAAWIHGGTGLDQFRDENHFTTYMRTWSLCAFVAPAAALGYYISDVIT